MPTALEKLLVRPTTVRLLRTILTTPGPLSFDTLDLHQCSKASVRNLGNSSASRVSKPFRIRYQSTPKWHSAELSEEGAENPKKAPPDNPQSLRARKKRRDPKRALSIRMIGHDVAQLIRKHDSDVEGAQPLSETRFNETTPRHVVETSHRHVQHEEDSMLDVDFQQDPVSPGTLSTLDQETFLILDKEPWLMQPLRAHTTGTVRKVAASEVSRQERALLVWADALKDAEDNDEVIYDIFHSMRREKIDLPTAGQFARVFWNSFLRSVTLTEPLVEYAMELKEASGKVYPSLYEQAILRHLTWAPARAESLHRMMNGHFPISKKFLQRIAPKLPAVQSTLDVFRLIYEDTNQDDVYDALMPGLLQSKNQKLAIEWHKYLVNNDDTPSDAVAERFGIQGGQIREGPHAQSIEHRSIKKTKNDAELTMDLYHDHDKVRFQSRDQGTSIPSTDRNDTICAKLFATKVVSVDTAIRGLGALGIQSIGPVAFRELVLRLNTSREIIAKIEDLKAHGIGVRQCAYATTVVTFARAGRDDLLGSLLRSDQHPDVLEDTDTQFRLLSFHMVRNEWEQVERTLRVLTHGAENPSVLAWNIYLRAAIQQSDNYHLETVARTLESMLFHRIPIEYESHVDLRGILRPRRRGKRPVPLPSGVPQMGPDATLIVNFYRRLMQSGDYVQPEAWIDIMKRIGMTGTLVELQRISFWILELYNEKHIRKIFVSQLIRAILAWSFRKSLSFRRQDPRLWSEGLKILRRIRDRGWHVSTRSVRAELRLKFIMLFANRVHRRNVLPRRKWGRYARMRNPFSIETMVREAEMIWGYPSYPLFDKSRFRKNWRDLPPKSLISNCDSMADDAHGLSRESRGHMPFAPAPNSLDSNSDPGTEDDLSIVETQDLSQGPRA